MNSYIAEERKYNFDLLPEYQRNRKVSLQSHCAIGYCSADMRPMQNMSMNIAAEHMYSFGLLPEFLNNLQVNLKSRYATEYYSADTRPTLYTSTNTAEEHKYKLAELPENRRYIRTEFLKSPNGSVNYSADTRPMQSN
jgi:hypothetical protein